MLNVALPGELRARVQGWRRRSERIALVPTMGNLHDGHLQLVRHARAIADRVVISIFINPMQFGVNEDYDAYPRTLEADSEALQRLDADLLFLPGMEVLYPRRIESSTRVSVPVLSDILCGEYRPGHFVGVATVVAKLFNLVEADVAIFGEKDYQQLVIIRRMVEDLCLPIEIEAVATVREADGLAMSSRNQYLTAGERAIAPQLYRVLCEVKTRVEAGDQDLAGIEQAAMAQLAAAAFRPDYVSIRRSSDLAPPEPGDRALRVLAAAGLGSARLIDNVSISIA